MSTSLRNKVAGVLSATALVVAAAGVTPALAAGFHGGGFHGGEFHHSVGRGLASGFHHGHYAHYGRRFAGNYGPRYGYGYGGWNGGYPDYGYYGGYACNPAFVILNPLACL